MMHSLKIFFLLSLSALFGWTMSLVNLENLELGTWNLELGTWNLELGTWNLELGTWKLALPYLLSKILQNVYAERDCIGKQIK